MTDDTSDSHDSTASAASGPFQCDHCGSLLDLSTWTPTVTNDDLSIHRFCDEECREAWTTE